MFSHNMSKKLHPRLVGQTRKDLVLSIFLWDHKMTSSSTACLVCGNFICSPFKKYCELMEYLFLVILITLFLGGWSLKKVLEVWLFSIDTIYKQTRRIANVKSTWRKKKFLTRQFLFVLLGIWSEELLMSLLL